MIFKTLGDPHLGRQFMNGVPLHRRGEREAQQWASFSSELRSGDEKILVCMGDLFDKPIVPNEVIVKAADAVIDASMHREIIILAGNHDLDRDLTKVSSFDIFDRLVDARIDSIRVITKPWVWKPYGLAFFPWNPIKSAEELVLETDLHGVHTVFGHWDVDLRSPAHNLIPTKLLAERGVYNAYTGHVHLPDQFERDGVSVTVTGSMLPYAHGEDATGDTYITVSLTELRYLRPEILRDKCVRVVLEPGETLDFDVDCLQLTVKRLDGEVADIAVTSEAFDLDNLFKLVFSEHTVPPLIAEQCLRRFKTIGA